MAKFTKTTDDQKVRDYIRDCIIEKYGTLQAFANKMDRTPSYFGNVLRGDRAMPDWLLKKFGVKHVVTTTEHWEAA